MSVLQNIVKVKISVFSIKCNSCFYPVPAKLMRQEVLIKLSQDLWDFNVH